VPVKNPQYVINGEVIFPDDPNYRANVCRTRFSGYEFNAVLLAACNKIMRYSWRRYSCMRKPEIPGYDYYLSMCQRSFFQKNQALFDFLHRDFESSFHDYTNYIDECIRHHADPHPKRQLRIDGFKGIVSDGVFFASDTPWVRTVQGKVKPDELAKFDVVAGEPKYGRIVVDLKIPASLQGFRFAEFYKIALSVDLYLGKNDEHVLHFCKQPTNLEFSRIASEALCPSRKSFFCYFSDDAVYIRNVGNNIRRFELDISSCDMSTGPPVFDRFVRSTPVAHRFTASLLRRQCNAKIKLVSTQDRSIYVVFKPKCDTEYSGSLLTTILNDLDNQAIGVAINDIPDDELSCASIILAAESAGFIVTCKEVSSFHGLQFLKNSPVLDSTGQPRMVINLGVMMRTYGSCHQDLPGRGPLIDRANAYNLSLLRGMYPCARIPLIESCKPSAVVALNNNDAVRLRYKVATDGDVFAVSDHEYFKRYSLDACDIDMLYASLHAGFGWFCSHPVVDKVLGADYELKSTTYQSFIVPPGIVVDSGS